MVKIQTDEQKLYFNKIKKTFGERNFLTEDDLAILEYPRVFPTNNSRFYNNVSKRANLALVDVDYLFNKLPDIYKEKIFSGIGIEQFLELIIEFGNAIKEKNKSKTKKEKKSKSNKKTKETEYQYTFDPKTFSIAVTMFNVSLSHIIKSLPNNLHQSLKNDIFHFLSTINGVAEIGMSKEKQNYVLPQVTPDLLPPWLQK